MKSILDPTFHYVPSTQTDLRKTFARVRREMAKGTPDTPPAPSSGAVVVLKRRPK
jgi:hypothetical protein